MYGFKNTYKIKNIKNNYDLDTIHCLVKKPTSFACNYISHEYNFLHQCYENINNDHNLQMSDILCFMEIKIHHTLIDVHKFINSSKYSYVSICDGHELMMMCNIHMHLGYFNVTTNNGS